MWFGRWVESRANETVERPVSAAERRKHTKRVQKYPTLAAQLGTVPTGHPQGPQDDRSVSPEVAEKVDELRKNPALLADFLRTNGEG